MTTMAEDAHEAGVLSGTLRRIIAEAFPGIEVSSTGDFWPMPSLEHGELSSSAAIEIARKTKENASAIAERIKGILEREIPADWRNDRGYLVCSAVPAEVLKTEVYGSVQESVRRLRDGNAPEVHRIWCLIPDNTTPSYARIRLVARVALQALLSVTYCGPTAMRLYPLPERRIQQPQDVVAYFREAVEWILSHEAEVRLSVELQELDSLWGERAFVWTSHHYHERLSAEVRASLSHARRDGRVISIMPADGWLLSRDRALAEILTNESLRQTSLLLMTLDLWKRFLFHAAGSISSGDFDPAVALFDEWASPLWSVRSLRGRLENLAPVYKLPLSREHALVLLDSIPQPRGLVVGALLMPSYTARAIVLGEVSVWMEAVERLGRHGHIVLNSPRTRVAAEQGALDSNGGKIAASVGFGLSCILPAITEETCGVQRLKVGVT